MVGNRKGSSRITALILAMLLMASLLPVCREVDFLPSAEADGEEVFLLLTSLADLKNGDTVAIAACDDGVDYVMSSEGSLPVGIQAERLSDRELIIPSSAATFKLEQHGAGWSFFDGTAYLACGSSIQQKINRNTDWAEDGVWTIELFDDDSCDVYADSESLNNHLWFNKGEGMRKFICGPAEGGEDLIRIRIYRDAGLQQETPSPEPSATPSPGQGTPTPGSESPTSNPENTPTSGTATPTPDPSNPVTYTITWRDEDGSVLARTSAGAGEVPEYPNELPEKPADAENTYTFAGWIPEPVPADRDATYTASYQAIPIQACGEAAFWKYSDGTLTISGSGAMDSYTGPEAVPWYKHSAQIERIAVSDGVTSIGDYAFENSRLLQTVQLPDSLKSIGAHAFCACICLRNMELPSGLQSIGKEAFAKCTVLQSVSFPNTLCEIGESAFSGCEALAELSLPGALESIGAYAFADCKSLPSARLPKQLKTLEKGLLSGCTSLESVELPDGIPVIGVWAFQNCESLQTVTVPNSVTEIGYGAFENCKRLREITISSGITDIGQKAFSGCIALTDVYYDGTEQMRKNIGMDLENEPLENATWHYRTEEREDPEIMPILLNGASLTLEGQISINFFVELPEGATAKNAILSYGKTGVKDRTVSLTPTAKYYNSEKQEYKITFPNIPAKEMTVPVTISVCDADGNRLALRHYKSGDVAGNAYSYCVADWAKNVLKDSSKEAKTHLLAKALLNYGEQAQKYFDYNTDHPANPEGYLQAEMKSVRPDDKYNAVIPENAKEKLAYNGASLLLEGATSIRLYFTEQVTARNDSGKAYTLHPSGKEWYVEIPNIASKNLDEKHIVIVTWNGNEGRFAYSALSYANGRLTNPSAKTDIKNLCKALYLYNDAANKYFAK